MLGKLGYTAEFYASGDLVLASLENRVVDVVLLDLKMPACDGFECARRYI
jgi:CheY-like chemotaxis protein